MNSHSVSARLTRLMIFIAAPRRCRRRLRRMVFLFLLIYFFCRFYSSRWRRHNSSSCWFCCSVRFIIRRISIAPPIGDRPRWRRPPPLTPPPTGSNDDGIKQKTSTRSQIRTIHPSEIQPKQSIRPKLHPSARAYLNRWSSLKVMKTNQMIDGKTLRGSISVRFPCRSASLSTISKMAAASDLGGLENWIEIGDSKHRETKKNSSRNRYESCFCCLFFFPRNLMEVFWKKNSASSSAEIPHRWVMTPAAVVFAFPRGSRSDLPENRNDWGKKK